jgi:hypothetical protein
MIKNISKITILGLLAAALVALPASSRAESTNAPATSDQKTPKHNPPFKGKVGAVDMSAQTLTVGKLTLQVTPETKITKDGKPATLADGVAGERVSGTYHKTADGKHNALTIHFGAKPEKENPETPGAGGKN